MTQPKAYILIPGKITSYNLLEPGKMGTKYWMEDSTKMGFYTIQKQME